MLGHEDVHHAGNESRLNRKTLISTSRADSARHELVAELGASFIGAIVGFKVEERDDHAAYIEHWLTALRNDKRAIFEAACAAQNAAEARSSTLKRKCVPACVAQRGHLFQKKKQN